MRRTQSWRFWRFSRRRKSTKSTTFCPDHSEAPLAGAIQILRFPQLHYSATYRFLQLCLPSITPFRINLLSSLNHITHTRLLYLRHFSLADVSSWTSPLLPANPVRDQGCQPERALRRSEPEGFSSLGRATESKIHENNRFKRSAPLRLKSVISRVFAILVCWFGVARKFRDFSRRAGSETRAQPDPKGRVETRVERTATPWKGSKPFASTSSPLAKRVAMRLTERF